MNMNNDITRAPKQEQLKNLLGEVRRKRETGEQELSPDVILEEGKPFGDYHLVKVLGRGGMGVVWEAEQVSLNRRVALKVLPPQSGLSSRGKERFMREAEAGARLNHRAIVSVYEVGDHNGVLYIAQELVDGGLTVSDHLSEMRSRGDLPDGYYRGVAELFLELAEALEVAHEAGVVHRDIKPANILITMGDQPKIADFGLATVEGTVDLSRTGELVGSPFYMSPEQAMSNRMGIDHRTDIFSLGATFYEALTLELPFKGDTYQEVLSSVATSDPLEPRKLRKGIPIDLAVICMKALEKNPDKRYHKVGAFADDLRRHLENRPILAKAPSAFVRLRKWAARHPVQTVAAIALVLVSGSLAQTVLSKQAEREAVLQQLAEAARNKQALEFMTGLFDQDNLEAALPGEGGRDLIVRLLDFGWSSIQDDSLEDPEFAANILQTIGGAYHNAGFPLKADEVLRKALVEIEGLTEQSASLRLQTQNALAGVLIDRGFFAEAEKLLLDIPKEGRSLTSNALLASSWAGLERYEDADNLLLEVARTYEAKEKSSERLRAQNVRGEIFLQSGDLESAVSIFEETLTARRKVDGVRAKTTLTSLMNLASCRFLQGKLEDSANLFQECFEGRKDVYGNQHRSTLKALAGLANISYTRKDYSTAARHFQEALDGYIFSLGKSEMARDPDVLTITSNLGKSLWKASETIGENPPLKSEAEGHLEWAHSNGIKHLGEDSLQAARFSYSYAHFLIMEKRFRAAKPILEQVLAVSEAELGLDNSLSQKSGAKLVLAMAASGEPKLALGLAEKLLVYSTPGSQEFKDLSALKSALRPKPKEG